MRTHIHKLNYIVGIKLNIEEDIDFSQPIVN
jgi:hypothetical protein